jgi:ribosomal protein S12 methylthiotransferase accessory factor YcaO
MNDIDPRMTAGIDLARRMGMREFQLRYSDDEQPVIWMAVASFSARNGRPVSTGKINAHSVGAALDPAEAVMRLLDELGDGATCTHCQRPTGVAHDLDEMPLAEHVCWYQFDPENVTYRRSCEGDT